MTLYFDLDSALLVSSPGTRDVVTSLNFKRGDSCTLSIQFVSSGVVQELDSGATGKLGVKAAGDYAGDYIAAAPTWIKTGTLTDTVYSFSINLATDEINALLSGSIPLVAAIAELEFIVGSIRTSSQTIPVTIYNDVIKGTESGPTDVATGAPVNGVAATLTVDPAGSNNSVLYTAATSGAAGNAITVGYGTPAAVLPISVAVVMGTGLSIQPSSKQNMVVSGSLSPDATGPLIYVGLRNGNPEWTSDGISSSLPHTSHVGAYKALWYNGSAWSMDLIDSFDVVYYRSICTSTAAFPDGLTFSSPSSGTGIPTIAAGISTAAQVIAAVNADSSASALVVASASGTVTGSVASVASANLSGGVTQTPGIPGCMSVDASFLYVVNSSGTWKKLALSSF